MIGSFAVFLILAGVEGSPLLADDVDNSARKMLVCGQKAAKKHEYEAALKCFDGAIEISPSWALPYYYRGLIRDQMGQSFKALADLDKSIKLDARRAIAFAARARAYANLGDFAKGLQDCD